MAGGATERGETTATQSADDYEKTLGEIEEAIGLVPGLMEALPEEDLVSEWPTFRRYTLAESEIPPKYREFVGLAVAANIKCPYCELFHRGAAQLHGATEEELREVVVLAGLTARWCAMIHAEHYDYDTFAEEFEGIGAHLREEGAADD